MSQRPVEDYVLEMVDREQTMRRNLATLPEFNRFVLLLNAIGWSSTKIAEVFQDHPHPPYRGPRKLDDLPQTHQAIGNIVIQAKKKFEAAE